MASGTTEKALTTIARRYKYETPSYAEVFSRPQDYNIRDLGDIDLLAIYPILVAGCIMLTPLLDWSLEIRENGRAIAVWWGLLMFAALVPTFIKVLNGVMPLLNPDQIATCETDITRHCTRQYVLNDFWMNKLSSDFYDKQVSRRGVF